MGLIINIAEALKNRADYNLLKEPLNDMLKDRQEAWEKKNPIDLLFKRGTLEGFQKTYTDSIGFARAFKETADHSVAPIFNTHAGFSQVYTSRTFQGGFIITQQVLEDEDYDSVKRTASKFMTRWHGDTVEYAMVAVESGFGIAKTFNPGDGESVLKLTSADTVDGDVMTATKNPLFTKAHTIVKRKGMTVADVIAKMQANAFCVKEGSNYGIDLDGSDPGKLAKLADVVNQAITYQENLKDDNDKYAGLSGTKMIVAPNDARLQGALNVVLGMEMLGNTMNPAYKRATLETTPYLRELECCFNKTKQRGVGFFIVDHAYNNENNGLEFTERVALTMNVEETKNPYGISYDGRQRFDINVASWRGITYVYIGEDEPVFIKVPVLQDAGTVADVTGFAALAPIVPIATMVKPVSIVGTVDTNA